MMSAQGEVGTFSIIPRIGVSIANLSGDKMTYSPEGDTKKSRNKAGFMGGADIEYMAAENMGVSLGAYYSVQGDRFPDMEITSSDGSITGRARCHTDLHYLNVPAMFNYYVTEGLALKAGCQVGFLLGAREQYEDTPITVNDKGEKSYGTTTKTKRTTTDSHRRIDVSLPIGLSYEYMNVIIDARYNIGFYNVNKSSLNLFKQRNRFFTVSVGYRFQM